MSPAILYYRQAEDRNKNKYYRNRDNKIPHNDYLNIWEVIIQAHKSPQVTVAVIYQ